MSLKLVLTWAALFMCARLYGGPSIMTTTTSDSMGVFTYSHKFFLGRDEQEKPIGIRGGYYINGQLDKRFDSFLKTFSKSDYNQLTDYQKQIALGLVLSFQGMPQDEDPTKSAQMARHQQELLSTEFYTLERSKQVELYASAFQDAFWEDDAPSDKIMRELMTAGTPLAKEVLCRAATQFIHRTDLQYGEAEDAEMAGKKLKSILKNHPKMKTELCQVNGANYDLAAIANAAELQAKHTLESERIQERNLAASAALIKKAQEEKKLMKCQPENLARVFSMSMDSLQSAQVGTNSFITAQFEGCRLEGRLEKQANGKFIYKFGVGSLRGDQMDLKDLATAWGMPIQFPAPKVVPTLAPALKRGKASP